MNKYHMTTEKKKFFDQFATLLHEIYHIMGFSRQLYQFFVDPATNKRKALSDTYIVKNNAKFPYLIKSPHVLEYAKKYFNCPNLEGVPVENAGGEGSAGSHWEKVVLGNEIMVADQVANPVLSHFTLKLLEDSGWYQINYNMAEPYFWGKNEGCQLMTGKCQFHSNTCNTDAAEGCFYDYTFQASCKGDTFTDDCKFFTGTDFSQHDCRVPENKAINDGHFGEYYGLKSRCFNGRIKGKKRLHGNMCYRSECRKGVISMRIGDQVYKCLYEGQKIKPTGVDGYVTCPDPKDFCAHDEALCENDCNLNGRCVVGNKCYCYPGYSGASCGIKNGRPLNNAILPLYKPGQDPKDKPVVKPETKPVVKPETKPVVKPETKPVVKPETKPVVKPETKPVVKPETKPVVKPETKPVVKPETKPVVKPETKPVVKPETKPVVKPETEPVVKP